MGRLAKAHSIIVACTSSRGYHLLQVVRSKQQLAAPAAQPSWIVISSKLPPQPTSKVTIPNLDLTQCSCKRGHVLHFVLMLDADTGGVKSQRQSCCRQRQPRNFTTAIAELLASDV